MVWLYVEDEMKDYGRTDNYAAPSFHYVLIGMMQCISMHLSKVFIKMLTLFVKCQYLLVKEDQLMKKT